MAEFKIGDTVKLKSDGPVMTIAWIGEPNPNDGSIPVRCKWFDDKRSEEQRYPMDALEAASM